MMTRIAVWPGTAAELRELKIAVKRNCECQNDVPDCPAHRMVEDQVTLNRLVFARRWAREHYAARNDGP